MARDAKLMYFGDGWLVKLGDRLHLATTQKEMVRLLNREVSYPKGKKNYWTNENTTCFICDQEFIDIRPREATETECPNCGHIELL